jgi:hypothetical protein
MITTSATSQNWKESQSTRVAREAWSDLVTIVVKLQSSILTHFKQGVKANVQLKSSIPIGAKVEIIPQGLYTRS